EADIKRRVRITGISVCDRSTRRRGDGKHLTTRVRVATLIADVFPASSGRIPAESVTIQGVWRQRHIQPHPLEPVVLGPAAVRLVAGKLAGIRASSQLASYQAYGGGAEN